MWVIQPLKIFLLLHVFTTCVFAKASTNNTVTDEAKRILADVIHQDKLQAQLRLKLAHDLQRKMAQNPEKGSDKNSKNSKHHTNNRTALLSTKENSLNTGVVTEGKNNETSKEPTRKNDSQKSGYYRGKTLGHVAKSNVSASHNDSKDSNQGQRTTNVLLTVVALPPSTQNDKKQTMTTTAKAKEPPKFKPGILHVLKINFISNSYPHVRKPHPKNIGPNSWPWLRQSNLHPSSSNPSSSPYRTILLQRVPQIRGTNPPNLHENLENILQSLLRLPFLNRPTVNEVNPSRIPSARTDGIRYYRHFVKPVLPEQLRIPNHYPRMWPALPRPNELMMMYNQLPPRPQHTYYSLPIFGPRITRPENPFNGLRHSSNGRLEVYPFVNYEPPSYNPRGTWRYITRIFPIQRNLNLCPPSLIPDYPCTKAHSLHW